MSLGRVGSVAPARLHEAARAAANGGIVVASVLAAALVFVVAIGVPPGAAASAFIEGAFGTSLNIAGTLSKMIPLTLVALAWIVAFRAGQLHVGFQGQILVAGLAASVVALRFSAPMGIHLALGIVAGVIGGALYAGLAAAFWRLRGVHPILSTLLLNLVAVELLAWWVREPFHDPSTPLPETVALPGSVLWPSLSGHGALHLDIVIVPLAAIGIHFLLRRTSIGYEIRVTGANPSFARASGVWTERVSVTAIVLSGALAGLAGTSLVLAGSTPAMTENFEAGYGFTGIAVALLARNSPLGVLPAALLFAALEQGGGSMEGTVGVPSSLVDLIQGFTIILVLVAATVEYRKRQRRLQTAVPTKTATPVPPSRDLGAVS